LSHGKMPYSISQKTAEFGINISIHVLILATFLTCFFFFYIAKIQRSTINDKMGQAIHTGLGDFLSDLADKDRYGTIQWDRVGDVAGFLKQRYAGSDQIVENNNQQLAQNTVVILVFMFTLIVLAVIFLRSHQYQIPIKPILVENAIVFTFVGMVEYFFFTRVATKYVPVKPDFLQKTLLTRLKRDISFV